MVDSACPRGFFMLVLLVQVILLLIFCFNRSLSKPNSESLFVTAVVLKSVPSTDTFFFLQSCCQYFLVTNLLCFLPFYGAIFKLHCVFFIVSFLLQARSPVLTAHRKVGSFLVSVTGPQMAQGVLFEVEYKLRHLLLFVPCGCLSLFGF